MPEGNPPKTSGEQNLKCQISRPKGQINVKAQMTKLKNDLAFGFLPSFELRNLSFGIYFRYE
jgi:hypothetical protein